MHKDTSVVLGIFIDAMVLLLDIFPVQEFQDAFLKLSGSFTANYFYLPRFFRGCSVNDIGECLFDSWAIFSDRVQVEM